MSVEVVNLIRYYSATTRPLVFIRTLSFNEDVRQRTEGSLRKYVVGIIKTRTDRSDYPSVNFQWTSPSLYYSGNRDNKERNVHLLWHPQRGGIVGTYILLLSVES